MLGALSPEGTGSGYSCAEFAFRRDSIRPGSVNWTVAIFGQAPSARRSFPTVAHDAVERSHERRGIEAAARGCRNACGPIWAGACGGDGWLFFAFDPGQIGFRPGRINRWTVDPGKTASRKIRNPPQHACAPTISIASPPIHGRRPIHGMPNAERMSVRSPPSALRRHR